MKKQREFDDNIVRSGTRVRESVRSLPKGHFQQIRQMFEKQTYSTKKLSTIYERQQKPILNDVLLRLPVTDDEKLKHRITNINDIKINHNKSSLEERYQDYLAEYQTFRLKLTNEFLQHKIMYPLKPNEHLFEKSISLSHENNLNQETLSHTTSLTEQQLPLSKLEESILITSQLNKQRQLAMSAIINYTDSYDSLTSNSLKRTGSSRQYVSSLQSTSDVHTKPVYLTTPTKCNLLKDNQSMISNETYNTLKSSRRLHSSTSLSSTGYDSNSSPSIKSKRNSIATNNSNDFIIQSTCSSSPTSSSSSSCPLSSSDEQQQQLSKPWIQYQSNTIKPSNDNDDVFESSNESSSSPLISRTEIKLNQPTIDSRPTNVIRHAVIRNSTLINSPSSSTTTTTTTSTHEPIIAPKNSNNLSYIVQTTSFPDHTIDRKIRRWNNVYGERIEIVNKSKRNRKYPLLSTNSMGFQVISSNNEQQQQQIEFDTLNTNSEQKKIYQQEENSSSLVETPVLYRLPPKKPPRTFENERKNDHLVESNSQKVPSPALSNENSPTFDRGTRSISCMDLTASVSNALLSNDHQHNHNSHRSSILLEKSIKISIPNENLNKPLTSIIQKDNQEQYLYNSSHSELNTTNKNNHTFHTPIIKPKQNNILITKKNSSMKKGISEPNLRKTSRNRSPFSPRALIDRFKRMLPLTLSKQSLNDKIINHNDNISTINDSDDTASTSSENTDHLRTSRLDHVSRVKDVYDSLNTSNHMSSLLTDPNISISINELKTLYDYVVHIIPEQELGYFSNGNGCLLSSNINQQQQQQYISTSTSIRFKYPLNANDEVTLKYFCFPDQNDSNNNPLLLMKTITQEYFRFTLTNMYGIRQYGYCSRFYHKGIINALCIVSPYDMIDVYEKILSTATELFLSYKDNDARKFLEEIYQHHLPNRGDTIHISTTTVGLYTLKCEYDRRKVLIDSVTLLSLSTEIIIKIFSSILYEQKIIFIGNELGPLTRLINTFICLLYPFSWPHTYVPILPSLMLDVIQAPTPYIIGILRSCESYLIANDDFVLQDNSDILIVDIDHDRIRSINDYLTNNTYRSSIENLHHFPLTHGDTTHFQILPKIFKIELKQEISLLRKTRLSLSLDECQQRLHNVFMSIFVQSCYNYKDYYNEKFQYEEFLQSKQHTIELFLEWFTHTQIFELFIRQKFENNNSNQYAITFDLACEKYSKTLNKQITPQRMTVKSIKRKSATRANKQENKF
ncbi:unnamed protein product [Rotaria sordida]|uniref:UDENN domain-containing protein n=1 Tax=Rotaria sordida TaxID=392033 RepID=A0A819HAR3_9BILA|nr:unnamed protein product [Rotaria sordida]CAF3892719.1 unnamed protein product [Rotaria sordida]